MLKKTEIGKPAGGGSGSTRKVTIVLDDEDEDGNDKNRPARHTAVAKTAPEGILTPPSFYEPHLTCLLPIDRKRRNMGVYSFFPVVV